MSMASSPRKSPRGGYPQQGPGPDHSSPPRQSLGYAQQHAMYGGPPPNWVGNGNVNVNPGASMGVTVAPGTPRSNPRPSHGSPPERDSGRKAEAGQDSSPPSHAYPPHYGPPPHHPGYHHPPPSHPFPHHPSQGALPGYPPYPGGGYGGPPPPGYYPPPHPGYQPSPSHGYPHPYPTPPPSVPQQRRQPPQASGTNSNSGGSSSDPRRRRGRTSDPSPGTALFRSPKKDGTCDERPKGGTSPIEDGGEKDAAAPSPRTSKRSPSSKSRAEKEVRPSAPVRKEAPAVSAPSSSVAPNVPPSNAFSNNPDVDEMEDLISEKVHPMRSDFHFYAMDRKNELLKTSSSMVARYVPPSNEKPDPKLIVTNLNERLMRCWEREGGKVRARYFGREEEDRRRFMTEDEIASRHCATLTARAKSPKIGGVKGNSGGGGVAVKVDDTGRSANIVEAEEEEGGPTGSKRQVIKTDPNDEEETEESPLKKMKAEDGADGVNGDYEEADLDNPSEKKDDSSNKSEGNDDGRKNEIRDEKQEP